MSEEKIIKIEEPIVKEEIGDKDLDENEKEER